MKKSSEKITALFEFNPYGALKGVFLNAANEGDQQILQRGLSDLLKSQKFSLLKRLFTKTLKES